MTFARALMAWLCVWAAQWTSALDVSGGEVFPGTLYSLGPRSSSRAKDIIDTLGNLAEDIPYALPFTSRDPSQNARQDTTEDPFQDKDTLPVGAMADKEEERDEAGDGMAGEEDQEEEGQDAGHNLTTTQKQEMAEREVLRRKIWELEEANRNLLGQVLLNDRRYTNKTTLQKTHDTRDVADGSSQKGTKNFRPADCADHLVYGATVSGVYDIYPFTVKRYEGLSASNV
ncbi:uncharacterized protein LOC122246391 [Penaeus japonicus]|uniref:uncharacterized protein LOC122246391 n=1 Tax=Penaeus japonicus TaxID=27405 RepID=UPI001C70E786|nr:uncharacterized protein LOC122246391 [Penaeus japonicus]